MFISGEEMDEEEGGGRRIGVFYYLLFSQVALCVICFDYRAIGGHKKVQGDSLMSYID